MFDALVAGKVVGTPKQGTSKNGNVYATVKMRVPIDNEGGVLFASVITFSESAVQALTALSDGDAVSVVGSVKLGTYQANDGQTRVSVDVTAQQVLTVYAIKRKRAKTQGEDEHQQQPRTSYRGRAQQPASSRDDPFGDEAFGDLP